MLPRAINAITTQTQKNIQSIFQFTTKTQICFICNSLLLFIFVENVQFI